jgi:pimeloyl-ACP methyl ester carboxylesterase
VPESVSTTDGETVAPRGAGLAVRRWPVDRGVPLVVVHGSMDRSASFRKLVRRLAAVDVTVYDRRGYGESIGLGPSTSTDQQVADLLAVLGERRAVVFGHSFGGLIALAAAAIRPDLFCSVLAYEAPVPWADWWPRDSAGGRAVFAHSDDPPAAAEAFMRRMIGDRQWERLAPSSRDARRAEGDALLAEMVAVRQGPPAYDPATLAVPVVSVRGSASSPHHRRAALELATHVAGGRLVEIDGAGHAAHLTHPDALAEVLLEELGVGDERSGRGPKLHPS